MLTYSTHALPATPRQPAEMAGIRGFSLLDATLTMGILGIMILAAVNSFSSDARLNHLSTEAHSLRLLMERAYTHALAYQERITIRLNQSNAAVHSSNGKTLERYTYRHGVRLDLKDRTEITVLCNPTISMSPATLRLEKGSSTCSVIISLRGRIRATC